MCTDRSICTKLDWIGATCTLVCEMMTIAMTASEFLQSIMKYSKHLRRNEQTDVPPAEALRSAIAVHGKATIHAGLNRTFANVLPISDALSVLYIAAQWLREPLLLSHIVAMVASGDIPMLSWNMHVSSEVKRTALPLAFLGPVEMPTLEFIFVRVIKIVVATGAPLAPMNLAPAVRRFCSRIGFPDAVATWALRFVSLHDVPALTNANLDSLYEWMIKQPPQIVVQQQERSALSVPDVWIAAIMVLYMRYVYGIGRHVDGATAESAAAVHAHVDGVTARWAMASAAEQRRQVLLLGYALHGDKDMGMHEADALGFFTSSSELLFHPSIIRGKEKSKVSEELHRDFSSISQLAEGAASKYVQDDERTMLRESTCWLSLPPLSSSSSLSSASRLLFDESLEDRRLPPRIPSHFAECVHSMPTYSKLVHALAMHVMLPATAIHTAVVKLELSIHKQEELREKRRRRSASKRPRQKH